LIFDQIEIKIKAQVWTEAFFS